jgi:hypothetical protein
MAPRVSSDPLASIVGMGCLDVHSMRPCALRCEQKHMRELMVVSDVFSSDWLRGEFLTLVCCSAQSFPCGEQLTRKLRSVRVVIADLECFAMARDELRYVHSVGGTRYRMVQIAAVVVLYRALSWPKIVKWATYRHHWRGCNDTGLPLI